MTRSAIEQLLATASLSGREIIEQYPDRQFFGFTCSYWPEELVLAAGMEPLRLFPVNSRAMPPELPSFSCSLARGVLAELKGAGLKKLAGLGLAQTCDTMQCLGSIARAVLSQPVSELVPPVLLAAPGAREYYLEELKVLWQALLNFSGQIPTGERIASVSGLYQRMRQLVRQIDESRPRLPSQLVASLLRAGQLMPREQYVTLLEEAVKALPDLEDTATGKIGLLLTGPVLEKDSLYLMLEELGGRVLVDDTCTGTRHYAEEQPEAGDQAAVTVEQLLEQVARRHLAMPPCPCRHRRLEERAEYLQRQAQAKGVQGAILVVRKYCEPHAFDAVPVAKALQGQGIKTLVLELEGPEAGGQERTRLQAFLESLG